LALLCIFVAEWQMGCVWGGDLQKDSNTSFLEFKWTPISLWSNSANLKDVFPPKKEKEWKICFLKKGKRMDWDSLCPSSQHFSKKIQFISMYFNIFQSISSKKEKECAGIHSIQNPSSPAAKSRADRSVPKIVNIVLKFLFF